MFSAEMMEEFYRETRRRKDPDLAMKKEIECFFDDFETLYKVDLGEFAVFYRDGKYKTQSEDEYHQKIEGSSYERFYHRLGRFKQNRSFPRFQHGFWWILHNCVAHIGIGLVPIKPCFDFHDWTSKKLNLGE